jgi:RecA-family ATPase
LEGLGKTMLVRQIGVMAACGLDPFRPLTREAYQPATVLVVDCENPERLSRRRFRVLAEASLTAQRRVPAGGVRVIHHPAGLDLTRGPHAEYLMERVTAHAPDILIIGPLYKLHNTNINDVLAARQGAMARAAARADNDSALIIEAHSGLAQNGDGQRELRPVGSSLFLRWPELGFGIRPKRVKDGDRTVTDPRHVEVRPWRGSREERDWPDELEWGPRGAWPWQVPIGQTPML